MQDNSVDLYKAVKENNKRKFLDIVYEKEKSFKYNLNYQAEDGTTSLRIACELGNKDIVEIILKDVRTNHCDVNLADNLGYTPLHVACMQNHLDIVIMLLAIPGININALTFDNTTSLYISALKGYYEVTYHLLQCSANVHISDKNGATALHVVSEHKNTDIARLLIAANADINAVNKYGWTPIHDAVQDHNFAVVEFLIESGGDVNITDIDGWTPLYVAAQNGYEDIANLLLKNKNTNINRVDKEGNTALLIATKYGHVDMIEMLLLAGADATIRNYLKEDPRDMHDSEDIKQLYKHYYLGFAAARLYHRKHNYDLNNTNNNTSSRSSSPLRTTSQNKLVPLTPLPPIKSNFGTAVSVEDTPSYRMFTSQDDNLLDSRMNYNSSSSPEMFSPLKQQLMIHESRLHSTTAVTENMELLNDKKDLVMKIAQIEITHYDGLKAAHSSLKDVEKRLQRKINNLTNQYNDLVETLNNNNKYHSVSSWYGFFIDVLVDFSRLILITIIFMLMVYSILISMNYFQHIIK